jgi:hypothetical protein
MKILPLRTCDRPLCELLEKALLEIDEFQTNRRYAIVKTKIEEAILRLHAEDT